jgi:putative (di)nucleoside polyphosphate hydrolase
VPLDAVVEFKREVYQQALSELSRYVFRPSRRPAGRMREPSGSGPVETALPEDAGGAPL